MEINDITISKAITENFMKDFQRAMDVEVAVGGAGPAGMAANAVFGAPRMGLIFGGASLGEAGC